MIGSGCGNDIPLHLEWRYKDKTNEKDILNLLKIHEQNGNRVYTFLDILEAVFKYPDFKKYKKLRHIVVNRLHDLYPLIPLHYRDEIHIQYKKVFQKILATYEQYEKCTRNYHYMVQFCLEH